MKFMSMVIAVLLYAAFAGWANADPRIELDTNTCHIPYDAADTDNEFKLTCRGVLFETADDGAVRGWARIRYPKVPAGFTADIKVSSDDSDATCTLQNDDGTEAQIDTWTVRIEEKCNARWCNAVFTIYCAEF